MPVAARGPTDRFSVSTNPRSGGESAHLLGKFDGIAYEIGDNLSHAIGITNNTARDLWADVEDQLFKGA